MPLLDSKGDAERHEEQSACLLPSWLDSSRQSILAQHEVSLCKTYLSSDRREAEVCLKTLSCYLCPATVQQLSSFLLCLCSVLLISASAFSSLNYLWWTTVCSKWVLQVCHPHSPITVHKFLHAAKRWHCLISSDYLHTPDNIHMSSLKDLTLSGENSIIHFLSPN